MGGLAKICKMYGSIEVVRKDGKKDVWYFDHANDKPRLKSEMTEEEIKASEKAKWKKKMTQNSVCAVNKTTEK